MSEYIGSRISLISKSDIRYVGTLVEINSEQSTVALEDVRSFGTEGRRSGEDEIPPSAAPYEYIIFRGSDVKDLRIEEAPKETKPAPPPVPNDPAILGSARPPPAQRNPPQPDHQPPGPGFGQQPPFGQYPPPFPPQNQGFERGFPGGPGGPGGPGPRGFLHEMPYGAPPGWYPPPGQGFPPQGPIGNQPPHAPGAGPQQQVGAKGPQPSPQAPGAPQQKPDSAPQKPQDTIKATSTAPPPPVEPKPDVAPATAPDPPQAPRAQTQPKARVMPAVPLTVKQAAPPMYAAATSTANAPNAAPQFQTATDAATAAVAAAMAKLPGRQKPEAEAMDNLTRKVNDMRTDDNIRHSRQQGTGGYAVGHRGRGGRRGGLRDQTSKPMDIPTTDFDFESANAKFNKQDLAKEVIASGSPIQGPGGANGSADTTETNGDALNGLSKAEEDVVIPPAAPAYDMKSSFFDNISSELKDRDETTGKKIGGMEFRTEERKRNLETFGQGSVDNFRGGYRGRGRRGFRARGGFNPRGRGQYRGGRGAPQGAGFSAPAANADES